MSLREHLQAIYDANGTLTPELVVEAARGKSSPLHALVFDRKPRDAADAWYRHRAHELIQSVRISYERSDGEPQSVRAFVAVRSEVGHVYEPAEKVAMDPLLREIVLRDMEREWRQLHARYGHFAEFIDLVGGTLKVAA